MLVLNPFKSDCVSVWGSCNAGLLNEIFEVQEGCARIRLLLFRLEPCRYFWNLSVATHQSHLYWKKTCTGLPLWETYMIQSLGCLIAFLSTYQLQLTAIKLRNSVRSSDDFILCKFTPQSLRIVRASASVSIFVLHKSECTFSKEQYNLVLRLVHWTQLPSKHSKNKTR